MKPLVTLGICAKNSEAYIDNAIKSIIQQDFPHDLMELILVDDGSEDHTLNIMYRWQFKTDIKINIFSKGWRGLGEARNTIVDNAEGDYIIWVDSDSILSKSYVRNQVNFMNSHPEIGVATGIFGILPEWSNILTLETLTWIAEHNSRSEKSNDFIHRNEKYPSTGGSIYRVNALRQVKGFNKRIIGGGEDIEVGKRLGDAGWKFCWNSFIWYETYGGMKTLKQLFKKYFLRGRDLQKIYRKGNKLFSLPFMVPPVAYLVGVYYAVSAYKLTRKKVCFLIPIHFGLKMTVWFAGFFWGQIQGDNNFVNK